MRVRQKALVSLVWAVALAFALLPPAEPAHAATIAVNSTADLAHTPDLVECPAIPLRVCTLRAAIQRVNQLGGPHTITLPAGTFTLSRTGRNEDNAATGDLDVKSGVNVTVQGVGSGVTNIDGEGVDRVFHVLAGGTLTLRQLHVQNGDARRDRRERRRRRRQPRRTNASAISNLAAASDGGGVRNRGTLTVTIANFVDNRTGAPATAGASRTAAR